jgi:hypothetical protein
MAAFAVSGERSARSLAAARSSTAAPAKNSSVCLANATTVRRTTPFARRWNTDSNSRSRPPRASESTAVTSETSRSRAVTSSVFDENVADARSGKEHRARGGAARSFGAASFGAAAATGPSATKNAPGIAPEDAARRWERLERGVRSDAGAVFVPIALVEHDSAPGTAGGRGARFVPGRSPSPRATPATVERGSTTLVADVERERV